MDKRFLTSPRAGIFYIGLASTVLFLVSQELNFDTAFAAEDDVQVDLKPLKPTIDPETERITGAGVKLGVKNIDIGNTKNAVEFSARPNMDGTKLMGTHITGKGSVEFGKNQFIVAGEGLIDPYGETKNSSVSTTFSHTGTHIDASAHGYYNPKTEDTRMGAKLYGTAPIGERDALKVGGEVTAGQHSSGDTTGRWKAGVTYTHGDTSVELNGSCNTENDDCRTEFRLKATWPSKK